MKHIIFAPKADSAAVFKFKPNEKIKKKYPAAPLQFLEMDLQEGELIFVAPKSRKFYEGILIVDINEGVIELHDFNNCWEENGGVPEAIIWDVERIIEAWASDD